MTEITANSHSKLPRVKRVNYRDTTELACSGARCRDNLQLNRAENGAQAHGTRRRSQAHAAPQAVSPMGKMREVLHAGDFSGPVTRDC